MSRPVEKSGVLLPSGQEAPLLDVNNLGVEFRTRSGTVHALEDISFSIAKGETVGIVGESGSGKSVMCYAILGILDAATPISAASTW
jgi:peptide/nickel transport system ATP-binding protein